MGNYKWLAHTQSWDPCKSTRVSVSLCRLHREGKGLGEPARTPAPRGWGSGGRAGSDLRCGGDGVTERTLSLQTHAEELLETGRPKLLSSHMGATCQRGANFSTGKVLFFLVLPEDALANA